MLRGVLERGAKVGAWGTCPAARGLVQADLLDGVHASSMHESARTVLAADRDATFCRWHKGPLALGRAGA